MYTTHLMAFVATKYKFTNLFQMVVTEEIKNLRRLEAQRNELNAKGWCEFSYLFDMKLVFSSNDHQPLKKEYSLQRLEDYFLRASKVQCALIN